MKGKRDSKLAPRARLCCFLGYSGSQKAYKLWDPIERAVIVSRDVTFDESISMSCLGRPEISLMELRRQIKLDRHTFPLPHRRILQVLRRRAMYSKKWEMYLELLKQWEQ